MNYQGNEKLRADVAVLANDMYEMHIRLRELSRIYLWNSDVLADRLCGHILRDAHDRYIEIYKAINELDHHFRE
ncbi:hypothetical protein B194_5443 [Serratia plymuthica A30]|uniref:hypothetical protein n=1 Tax=Serratia plymuthica TaxID=82996 RepID=UPI0002A3EDD8|nr:hypothetical protein [Serratia plymuthica]EKF67041.1 hypothetical protein B194_5443 [Serratia plymuthica A30]